MHQWVKGGGGQAHEITERWRILQTLYQRHQEKHRTYRDVMQVLMHPLAELAQAASGCSLEQYVDQQKLWSTPYYSIPAYKHLRGIWKHGRVDLVTRGDGLQYLRTIQLDLLPEDHQLALWKEAWGDYQEVLKRTITQVDTPELLNASWFKRNVSKDLVSLRIWLRKWVKGKEEAPKVALRNTTYDEALSLLVNTLSLGTKEQDYPKNDDALENLKDAYDLLIEGGEGAELYIQEAQALEPTSLSYRKEDGMTFWDEVIQGFLENRIEERTLEKLGSEASLFGLNVSPILLQRLWERQPSMRSTLNHLAEHYPAWSHWRDLSLLFPREGERQLILTPDLWVSISDDFYNQVFDEGGDFKAFNIHDGRQVGRRRVAKVMLSNGNAFCVKEYPELPGIEYAVSSLMNQVMGRGAVPSLLVRYEGIPYLLTPYMEGSVKDLLERDPQSLDEIEHEEAILLAMLTNPEDGSPHNYRINLRGERPYIVGIDNDHSLGPSMESSYVAERHRFRKDATQSVNIKTWLFCTDTMVKQIRGELVARIATIDTQEFLKNWVRGLKARSDQYQGIFSPAEQREYMEGVPKTVPIEERQIVLPKVVLTREMILRLYSKMEQMKMVLGEKPDMSYLELLYRIDPVLGKRHIPPFVKFPPATDAWIPLALKYGVTSAPSGTPHEHTLRRLAAVGEREFAQGFGSKTTSLGFLNIILGKQEVMPTELRGDPTIYEPFESEPLEEALYQAKDQYHLQRYAATREEYLKLTSDAKGDFLSNLPWGRMGEAAENAWIQTMMEDPSSRECHRLKIRGSVALRTSVFEKMALQNLRELNLSGCSLIGPKVLRVLSGSGVYKLTLKNMGTMTRGFELEDRSWVNVREGAMFPHLEVLNLSENKELETFSIVAPGLKKIDLTGCDRFKEEKMPFMKPDLLIQLILQYESLEWIGGNLGTYGEALKTLLPLGKRTTLDCRGGLYHLVVEMYALLKLFPGMSSLTLLRMNGHMGGTSRAKEMVPAFSSLTALTSLTLSGGMRSKSLEDTVNDRVGYTGVEQLIPAFTRMKRLTILDLSANEIGDTGVEALSRVLPSMTALTKLDLRENKFGDAGTKALSRALPSMTALRELNLLGNHGAAGVGALAPVLPQMTALTSLGLGSNQIGDAEAKTLSDVLSSMTALRELYLEWNKFSDAGVEVLAPALSSMTALRELNLGRNQIGDAEAKTLSDVLSSMTALRELYLGGNQIGATGVGALSRVLPSLTGLTMLYLWGNQIGDAGTKALSRALPSMTALRELNLRWNRIGKDLKEKIDQVLKECCRLQALKDPTSPNATLREVSTDYIQKRQRLRLLDKVPQLVLEYPALPPFNGAHLVGVFTHSDMIPLVWFLNSALTRRSFSSCFDGFATTGGLSLVPLAANRMIQVLRAYDDGILSYVEKKILFPQDKVLSEFEKPVFISYLTSSSRKDLGIEEGEGSDDEGVPHEDQEAKYYSRFQARRACPSMIDHQDLPVVDVLEQVLTHRPYLNLEQVYLDMQDEFHTDNILFLQFGETEAIIPHPSRVVLSAIPPSLQSKYEAFKGKTIDQDDLFRDADPFLHQLVQQFRTKQLTLSAIESEYLDPDDGEGLLRSLREDMIPLSLMTDDRLLLKEIVRRQKVDCFRAYRVFDSSLSLEEVKDLEGGIRLISPLWSLESITTFPRTDPEVVRTIGLRLIEARDPRIEEWGEGVMPFIQASWQKRGLEVMVEDIHADRYNEAFMNILFPRTYDWERVRDRLIDSLLEGKDTSDQARGTIKVIKTFRDRIRDEQYFKTPFRGKPLLHHAVQQGKSFLARELLDNQLGDPFLLDEGGYNALHHAISLKQVPVVGQLVAFVGRSGIGALRSFVLAPEGNSPLDMILRQMVTPTPEDLEIYHMLSKVQEEGDLKETKEQKRIITGDLKLKGFYDGFQRIMNQMLLAHQVLATDLVERHSGENWIESGLKVAGENIPFPGAKIVGNILAGAVGSYREGKEKHITERAARMFLSPVAMSEGVEGIARRLTLAYQGPLRELTETEKFGETVAKRVLSYWVRYEGKVSEFSNITTYLSTKETGRIVGTLQRIIPSFVRRFLLEETFVIVQGIQQSADDFLASIGIEDGARVYTPLPYPSLYHRLGTREEAIRLGFYENNGRGYVKLGSGDSSQGDFNWKGPIAAAATGAIIAGLEEGGVVVTKNPLSEGFSIDTEKVMETVASAKKCGCSIL